jgi:glycosyltransferase involved in cell wall biosynthesis
MDVNGDFVIGVDPRFISTSKMEGHSRVWFTALEELGRIATVATLDYGATTRPAVWLHNGHAAMPHVSEPVVSVMHEARWVDPSLAADLAPGFVESIAPRTAECVQRSARLVVPSYASAQNVVRLGATAEKVSVVPYGVDLDVFRPGLTGGRELVRGVTNDDRPYIISVATLFRGKNLPLLRDAVVRLQQQGFPHRLVLVAAAAGDGSDSTAQRAELENGESSVAIFQRIPEAELAALIADADVFCLPSRFEGFGLPALEALACGVPTVVSDCGALPEVVAGAGLVVKPMVSEIEQAIATILSSPQFGARLRAKARMRAERFSWQATAKGWKHAIGRAVSERGNS